MIGYYLGVDPDNGGGIAAVTRERQLVVEPFDGRLDKSTAGPAVVWDDVFEAFQRLVDLLTPEVVAQVFSNSPEISERHAHDTAACYKRQELAAGNPLFCRAALERAPVSIPGKRTHATTWRLSELHAWCYVECRRRLVGVDSVAPNTWQSHFRVPKKLARPARKRWLHNKAQELYPQVEFPERMADAVLLAEYALRIGGDR